MFQPPSKRSKGIGRDWANLEGTELAFWKEQARKENENSASKAGVEQERQYAWELVNARNGRSPKRSVSINLGYLLVEMKTRIKNNQKFC